MLLIWPRMDGRESQTAIRTLPFINLKPVLVLVVLERVRPPPQEETDYEATSRSFSLLIVSSGCCSYNPIQPILLRLVS